MKDMKWNMVIVMTVGLILMACWGTSVRAAQSTLSKKELNTLIANAKTPQDHERLAAYYRSQEQQAKEKQAEHQEMLRRYHENPLSHRFTKSPSPDDHCRALIRIFGDEARHDAALGAYHEKISKDLSKQN